MTGALLLDMDGTLIDSEPLWHDRMRALARERGFAWTEEDCRWTTGRPMTEWAQRMVERGAGLEPRAMIDRVVAEVAEIVRGEVPWLPGSLALLERIVADGVPAALVTNAGAPNAQALVDAAPRGALRLAVSSDDGVASKPDPAPYLLAAERLGVDPARCIAFEDSGSGARSAVAAGAALWFLTTQQSEPPVAAERVLGTLADVDADELFARLERGAPA